MSTAAHVIGALLRFLFAVVRWVVTLAVHERMLAFVVFVILVVLVLFRRVALTRHGQGWRRVRSIRFRLWLWLRPGRGFASLPELWLRWGRLAALSYGARSRPGAGPARQAHPAGHRVRGAARPGAVRPPPVRRLRAARADPGAAADRQDGAARRPDHPASRPGADHQHPGRPAPAHQPVAGRRPRPGLRVQPGAASATSRPRSRWDLLGVCTDELMAYKMADWLAGEHGRLRRPGLV